jgi:hypothetical protein
MNPNEVKEVNIQVIDFQSLIQHDCTRNDAHTHDYDSKVLSLRSSNSIDQFVQSKRIKHDVTEARHVDLNEGDWILDICLDFFSTYNPFLVNLKSMVERDFDKGKHLINGRNAPSPDIGSILSMIVNMYGWLPYRSETVIDKYDAKQLRMMRFKSLNVVQDILLCDRKDAEVYRIIREKFLGLYEDSNRRHDMMLLVDDIFDIISVETKQEISQSNLQLLLPNYRSSFDEIDRNIHHMYTILTDLIFDNVRDDNNHNNRIQICKNRLPTVITIARSSLDGFTPSDQVDFIQTKLFIMLDRLLSAWYEKNQRNEMIKPKIVHYDLCEDAQNKSYSIFLHPKAQDFITLDITKINSL